MQCNESGFCAHTAKSDIFAQFQIELSKETHSTLFSVSSKEFSCKNARNLSWTSRIVQYLKTCSRPVNYFYPLCFRSFAMLLGWWMWRTKWSSMFETCLVYSCWLIYLRQTTYTMKHLFWGIAHTVPYGLLIALTYCKLFGK